MKAQLSKPKQEPQKPLPQQVTISAAKGRPMLVWVGKRALRQVTHFPAQHIESFNPQGGLLFHGDNIATRWVSSYSTLIFGRMILTYSLCMSVSCYSASCLWNKGAFFSIVMMFEIISLGC
jgi:hypothetical protein